MNILNREKLKSAYRSLLGTSIGDAFGETFFGDAEEINKRIAERQPAGGEWLFTDDTVMSIAIYKTLEKFGHIDQDFLAAAFSNNYKKDNYRGYGGTAHSILRSIGEGKNWKTVAASVFDGMGSMGNGAAMRTGLIGAFFSDDFDQLKLAAEQSAAVTHAHPEAKVGAVAVAVAAAITQNMSNTGEKLAPDDFLCQILEHLPDSDTKSKINKARHVPVDYHIDSVVAILGNGTKMTAQDTVPFALWCVAHYHSHFEEALWKAVSALGDRDTICAIVGGIVILSAPESTVPGLWAASTESFEKSVFWQNN